MTEQQLTILAVDDNDAQLYALRRNLTLAGFKVLSASNGSETLELARQNPAAIVLDVHLPDLDGFEICRRLKADPQTAEIPVVLVTATYHDAYALEVGKQAGASAFLFSPIETETLLAVIRGAMARGAGK